MSSGKKILRLTLFVGTLGTLSGSEYLLDDYYTYGNPIDISHGNTKYSMQYYQGKRENDYTLRKDNKVCLFHNGVLKMVYQVDEKGGQVGDFTQFENGRVQFVQSFDDIMDRRNFNRIVNHVKGERLEIYTYDNEKLIYRGEFNSQRQREGWGIQYDDKTGDMLLEGIWKGNKLVEILRMIEGNIMTEFKRNGDNMTASHRIPVYVGEFKYDELNESFIRNGRGYLINEETRIAYREGEWTDGEEVSGRDLYDGWYTPSSASNSHVVVRPSVPSSFVQGSAQEAVSPSFDMNSLDLSIKNLEIPSKCCNNVNTLDLNRYRSLESIEIGDECFENVDLFRIDGLSRLKRLKIGENSFTHIKSTVEWKRDLVQNNARSFHVVNCPQLSSIEIGEFSFSDYAGQFELRNLPSLEGLKIGASLNTFMHYIYMRVHIHYINSSSNFTYSSLILRGRSVVGMLDVDLPKLKTVVIGNLAFDEACSVVFESKWNGFVSSLDLPSLESIDFGEWAANGRDEDCCELVMRSRVQQLLVSRSSQAPYL